LLFRDVDRFNTGNSILIEGSLAAKAQNTTRIPVKRLDDLVIAGTDRINLMKIDVEGFEIAVRQGAGLTLRRTDLVLIEFNHWCLTSIARMFPEDALNYVFSTFKAVFVYDAAKKEYRRIVSDEEKWGFLHRNMVKFNVNDLLCTNDEELAAKLMP
jgi:hypothetical protein